MSIDEATPQDWDRSNNRIASKPYVDPYDQPPEDSELRVPCSPYGSVQPNPPVADPVSAPPHYNTGNIECIDAIEQSMTPHAFKGYCKGNALKYIWRMSYKGKPVEDLRKAVWYLERLIKFEIDNPTNK